MTRCRRVGLVGTPLLTVALLAGCSRSGSQPREQVVFSVVTGFSLTGSSSVVDMVDLALPGLINVSDNAVRITGVRLVSLPSGVHLRSVTAYNSDLAIGLANGDLLRYCRSVYRPFPVSDAIMPAHFESRWNIVLAITFAKPGRYHLGRAKIFYSTNGHAGWQYQNLNTTLTITAASTGSKPGPTECP